MKRYLFGLLCFFSLAVQAEMDVTRELSAPEQLVPGQPITLAITFWTDSWFNPPPEWPEMDIENGSLLTTALPNQLVTRNDNGMSWSGIRMERQIMAWEQGVLRLPALNMVVRSANQPPKTVTLPAMEKAVIWPADVRQPDRFLPASSLELTQQWHVFRAAEGDKLHVGDVVERVVTVRATGVIAAQIPQLLYAIPGSDTQRLTPENSVLTQGRGEITGAQRVERLRYLPATAGELSVPPVHLRWWNTQDNAWQEADLPGARYTFAAATATGSEQSLKAKAPIDWKTLLVVIGAGVLIIIALFFFRRALWHALRHLSRRTHDIWRIVPLPELIPAKRSKR